MTWRSLFILVSLSACASTVWKNDQEAPPAHYADQLVDYNALTDEALLTLKKYISEMLLELIDHAKNASNQAYANELRTYSKEQVRSILNIDHKQNKSVKIDELIDEIRRSSFEQFLIQSPELDTDSSLYSNISLEGKDFIKVRIKPTLKLFAPDTLKVWKVDFWYSGKNEH